VSTVPRSASSVRSASALGKTIVPGGAVGVGSTATARAAASVRRASARLPTQDVVTPTATSNAAAIPAPSSARRVRLTRSPPRAAAAAPPSPSTTSGKKRSRKTHCGTRRVAAGGA
jgi:hypothetical protein